MELHFRQFKDTAIFQKIFLNAIRTNCLLFFRTIKMLGEKKINKRRLYSSKTRGIFDSFTNLNQDDFPDLKRMGFGKQINEMKLESGSYGARILFNRFKEKIVFHYKLLRDIPYAGGVSLFFYT